MERPQSRGRAQPGSSHAPKMAKNEAVVQRENGSYINYDVPLSSMNLKALKGFLPPSGAMGLQSPSSHSPVTELGAASRRTQQRKTTVIDTLPNTDAFKPLGLSMGFSVSSIGVGGQQSMPLMHDSSQQSMSRAPSSGQGLAAELNHHRMSADHVFGGVTSFTSTQPAAAAVVLDDTWTPLGTTPSTKPMSLLSTYKPGAPAIHDGGTIIPGYVAPGNRSRPGVPDSTFSHRAAHSSHGVVGSSRTGGRKQQQQGSLRPMTSPLDVVPGITYSKGHISAVHTKVGSQNKPAGSSSSGLNVRNATLSRVHNGAGLILTETARSPLLPTAGPFLSHNSGGTMLVPAVPAWTSPYPLSPTGSIPSAMPSFIMPGSPSPNGRPPFAMFSASTQEDSAKAWAMYLQGVYDSVQPRHSEEEENMLMGGTTGEGQQFYSAMGDGSAASNDESRIRQENVDYQVPPLILPVYLPGGQEIPFNDVPITSTCDTQDTQEMRDTRDSRDVGGYAEGASRSSYAPESARTGGAGGEHVHISPVQFDWSPFASIVPRPALLYIPPSDEEDSAHLSQLTAAARSMASAGAGGMNPSRMFLSSIAGTVAAAAEEAVPSCPAGIPPSIRHAYPTSFLLALVTDLCSEINATANAAADVPSAWLFMLSFACDARVAWDASTAVVQAKAGVALGLRGTETGNGGAVEFLLQLETGMVPTLLPTTKSEDGIDGMRAIDAATARHLLPYAAPLAGVVVEDAITRITRRMVSASRLPTLSCAALFVRACLAFAGWGSLNNAAATIMRSLLVESDGSMAPEAHRVRSASPNRPGTHATAHAAAHALVKSSVDVALAELEATLLEPTSTPTDTFEHICEPAGVRVSGILISQAQARASCAASHAHDSDGSSSDLVSTFDRKAWSIASYARSRAVSVPTLEALLASPASVLGPHFSFARACMCPPPTLEELSAMIEGQKFEGRDSFSARWGPGGGLGRVAASTQRCMETVLGESRLEQAIAAEAHSEIAEGKSPDAATQSTIGLALVFTNRNGDRALLDPATGRPMSLHTTVSVRNAHNAMVALGREGRKRVQGLAAALRIAGPLTRQEGPRSELTPITSVPEECVVPVEQEQALSATNTDIGYVTALPAEDTPVSPLRYSTPGESPHQDSSSGISVSLHPTDSSPSLAAATEADVVQVDEPADLHGAVPAVASVSQA